MPNQKELFNTSLYPFDIQGRPRDLPAGRRVRGDLFGGRYAEQAA
jgi:hypothetical protein